MNIHLNRFAKPRSILLATLLLFVSNIHAEITVENVADINPNPETEPSTNPSSLTEYNNKLYYIAQIRGKNTQLWAYDPTDDTTTLAVDLPGHYDSVPKHLT
ncbi:MAG: hypothetical protein ACI8WB_005904, partial [Phenylobacterium sp.]